jgi:hypothetical protein
MTQDLRTIGSLDEVAELIERRDDVYVRWSRGPAYDHRMESYDELTGVPLPGLSASPLAVESWWEGRSVRLWAARRLYDYRHLREVRGSGVRPWVLAGHEVARGPDNEPLVVCEEALAWLALDVVEEATRLVDEQEGSWGSLNRQR